MERRPDEPAFRFRRMVPIQACLSHRSNGDVTPLLKAHDV
jgi:hypothetical protein